MRTYIGIRSALIALVISGQALLADTSSAPVALQAQPFDLQSVRLLDSPFRDAMTRDGNYLLSLDTDRLLHVFRLNAGLPSTVRPYGGWEDPSCELRGHSVGHYLSACSLMYASTGDARFKDRADKIVAGFAECQKALAATSSHPGYLSAFPESFIDRVENRKPVWAPWYTLHKVMAGLLDAYQLCGNQQALVTLTNMADWVKSRVDKLPVEKMQASLDTEHGGMNEVFANLYAVTGNPDHLRMAEAFNHHKVLDPLAHDQDKLNGLHANTQIPKVIGAAREYEVTGNTNDEEIAKFFWERVALDRSFVIGGHSDREHFFPVTDFAKHLSAETAETCNTYNMLKLSRHIFEWQPDATVMDFYERALYNHILASQDPDEGMFVYLMSLKPGHFKTYSTPENSFWCCVGTGMENHAKYGDTIYFHGNDSLYVNLFIPSELKWAEKKMTVRQETKFPESDTTTLTFKVEKPTKLALKVRWPEWADSMSVRVNGKKQTIDGKPDSYVTIDREFRNGDKVEVQLPMKLHTEFLPNTTNTIAVLYGPIVLAGELGTNMPSPYARNQTDQVTVPDPFVPVFLANSNSVLSHIKPTAKPLVFQTKNLGRPNDVTLIPFYKAHHERYSVYWKLMSETEWKTQAAQLKAEDDRRIAIEAQTVDTVYPGEQQSETDHKQRGEKSDPVDVFGRKLRHATDGGWFSYEVKVDGTQTNQLVCTWWGDESGERNFDILVDGQKIASEKLLHNRPGKYWDATYPIPTELTHGKNKVTVKFQAQPGNFAGGLFGLRVVRAK